LLEVLRDAKLKQPMVAGNSDSVQFERNGYFVRDKDSKPGHPVFNRTVGCATPGRR
jgi:glutaminyl-tRNA synthetase